MIDFYQKLEEISKGRCMILVVSSVPWGFLATWLHERHLRCNISDHSKATAGPQLPGVIWIEMLHVSVICTKIIIASEVEKTMPCPCKFLVETSAAFAESLHK